MNLSSFFKKYYVAFSSDNAHKSFVFCPFIFPRRKCNQCVWSGSLLPFFLNEPLSRLQPDTMRTVAPSLQQPARASCCLRPPRVNPIKAVICPATPAARWGGGHALAAGCRELLTQTSTKSYLISVGNVKEEEERILIYVEKSTFFNSCVCVPSRGHHILFLIKQNILYPL